MLFVLLSSGERRRSFFEPGNALVVIAERSFDAIQSLDHFVETTIHVTLEIVQSVIDVVDALVDPIESAILNNAGNEKSDEDRKSYLQRTAERR